MAERYEKLEKIGGGGYADVFKAQDTYTGTIVALKELRAPSPDNFRRFRRERDMLDLNRDNFNVVNLLDNDLDADKPYLVLEYSELGSLQQYVANRVSWEQVACWMYDVALALSPIHQKGDWHRDIKPSNILVFKTPDGELYVKITDFGLAQRIDNPSGPMTDSPHGTPGYKDPVAVLMNNYTAASDIYSLGVTVKELLTGSRDATLYPYNVPAELRNLISRMTSWNRDNRPTAAEICQAANDLFTPKQPVPVQAPVVQPSPSIGIGGLLGTLAVGLAAAAFLSNINDYDENMGRYRNGRGQFRSGWWG